MRIRRTLGQNVYRLRLKAGLTQTQLADFTNLSCRYIQKIEHGEANITIEVALKLRHVLKCSWDDLVRNI